MMQFQYTIITIVLGSLFALTSCANANLKELSDYETVKTQTITLVDWSEKSSLKYIPISLQIENEEPYVFMIDTGSSISTIRKDIAERFGLMKGPLEAITFDGVEGDGTGRLTDMATVKFPGVNHTYTGRFVVEDTLTGGSYPEGVVGLVGSDVLYKSTLRNFPGVKMTLELPISHQRCDIADQQSTCFRETNLSPKVQGEWGGYPAQFFLDTGATDISDAIMLVSTQAKKFWYGNPYRILTYDLPFVSSLPIGLTIQQGVSIGSLEKCDLVTWIKDPEDGSAFEDEMAFLLGLNFLIRTSFSVTIGSEEGQIDTGPCPKTKLSTTGISGFEVDPERTDELIITKLDHGSPAWYSGIRTGDILLGVMDMKGTLHSRFEEEFKNSLSMHMSAPAGETIYVFVLGDEIETHELKTSRYQILETRPK